MNKIVIAGTGVAICVLLGSTAAFAAERPNLSLPNGIGNMPQFEFSLKDGFGKGMGTFRADMEEHRATMRVQMEAHRAAMEEKLAEVRETAADMSAFEQYGLVNDEAKGGWCFNGKLVGLFVDKQGRGITFLNHNGEVHIKTIRDANGNVTNLVELSADEYNTIIAEMDAMRDDMQEQMNEMRQNREARMNEMHRSMEEFRSNMGQRMNRPGGFMENKGN